MIKRNIGLILPIAILAVIVLSSVLAPLLAPFPPNQVDMSVRLQGPCAEHIFGTDVLGRDMFSRILYGGRTSIVLALTATIMSMLLGMILGVLAGYWGGAVDWVITSVVNIFQGLPGISLIVAIAGVLGPGIGNLLLALVVTNWAGYSRIVRTETIKLREEPYIEGLRCLGCGNVWLIVRHIVPNMLNSTLVLFTTRLGRSVLAIAALSFLGLGVQPPTPDWSVMINDARMHYRAAPHLIIAPGMSLLLLVFAINMLGDELRDRFDVKNQEVCNY
ncbi:MAG: ABC transporter permease [Defluviitaleaceae bacterium]|nr:ABC transporter permease [Defluviitaleaceae bacterium]